MAELIRTVFPILFVVGIYWLLWRLFLVVLRLTVKTVSKAWHAGKEL